MQGVFYCSSPEQLVNSGTSFDRCGLHRSCCRPFALLYSLFPNRIDLFSVITQPLRLSLKLSPKDSANFQVPHLFLQIGYLEWGTKFNTDLAGMDFFADIINTLQPHSKQNPDMDNSGTFLGWYTYGTIPCQVVQMLLFTRRRKVYVIW